jgi:hypothetical protein
MANGATVRLPLALESAAAPASDKPSEPIETAIGAAMADAVTVFCEAAIAQQETGLLPPAIIAAGGSRVATIAMLQLEHELGDDDFFRRAHEQGKCVLHQYLGADLFRQHGPGQVDMVLDMAIDSVFEIVSKVVKDERAVRVAWAH